MSRTNDTVEELRRQVGTDYRHLRGMLRRVTITVTSKPFWQTVGLLLIDSATKETQEVEVYSGIGFYSRPAPGVNPEGIVGFVGERCNPAILATRDEDTRKRVAKIDQDETAVFNTKAVMLVSKAGKVLAYLAGHVADAVGLAKASELNNLRAFVEQQFSGAGHLHTVSGSTTTATTPVVLPVVLPSSDYPGTVVLKGQ